MANARAKHLRANQTDAERHLWYRLRRRALLGWRFRRQVPLGPYIVDFFCPEARLVVEVDGGQHVERAACDAARTVWLEDDGHRVLRFWNNEVFENIDGVLAIIAAALGSAPPPRPSTARGEGD